MNLSKLAIAALITSGLFVACSEEISENTVDTQYAAQTGNLGNAGQAVDLGLPSGTLWANKNVGASSETDNGLLFICCLHSIHPVIPARLFPFQFLC